MNKVYSRINWHNNTDPAINETNLNKMDYALNEIDNRVVDLARFEPAARQSAEDSEAWAKGTRNGTAVPSSDETYHNNSKYYAESISGAAQTATQKANEASQSAAAAQEAAREAQSLITVDSAMSTTSTNSLQNKVITKALANGNISFGIDSGGNYGYIKAGADTVIPFKNPTGTKSDSYSSNGAYNVDVTNYAQHNVTVNVPQPSGTKTDSYTTNGTYNVDITSYAAHRVTVNVPSSEPTLQEKTVSPNTSTQYVTPDTAQGYDGLSKVTVNAIQTETASVTLRDSAQTIVPTSGRYLTSVSVPAVVGNAGQGEVLSGNTFSSAYYPTGSTGTIPRFADYRYIPDKPLQIRNRTSYTDGNGDSHSISSTKFVTIYEGATGYNGSASYELMILASRFGTATPSQVLSSATFTSGNVNNVATQGAIETQSASDVTISAAKDYAAGYYPNAWRVTPQGPSLGTKTFTPSTSSQTRSASQDGYDGYSSVTVNAIPNQRTQGDVTISSQTTFPFGWYPNSFRVTPTGGSRFAYGLGTSATGNYTITYPSGMERPWSIIQITETESPTGTNLDGNTVELILDDETRWCSTIYWETGEIPSTYSFRTLRLYGLSTNYKMWREYSYQIGASDTTKSTVVSINETARTITIHYVRKTPDYYTTVYLYSCDPTVTS